MIPALTLDLTYTLAPIAAASIGAVLVGLAAIVVRAIQEEPRRARRPVSVQVGAGATFESTARLADQPSAAA